MNNNVITWFDVPTLDFDRAVNFYSEILGAKITVRKRMGQKHGFFPVPDGSKSMPSDPSGPGAGGNIVQPHPGHKPSREGTRIYLNCDGRLDEVLGRVVKAGGKIVQPKFSIGAPGWISLIEDTEGNLIGLHSRK